MVKISIITAVLNDKYGLTKTLESLVHVEKAYYEHVIIDGGSIDGTLDVIKQFSERVDIVVSESDKGTYDAMNKGVLRASGEVISFLNAGDLALDGYIDYPNECFDSDSSVDYCYAGVLLHGKKRDTHYIPKEFTPSSEYLQAMPFPHPGLFVKKKLFEKVGCFNLSKK